MVVPMQVFGVYAALWSFRSATVSLFRAIGRPDYDTKTRVLKLALILPFIYSASQAFDVSGVALVVLGHTVVVAPVASYVVVRSVEGSVVTLGHGQGFDSSGTVATRTVVETNGLDPYGRHNIIYQIKTISRFPPSTISGGTGITGLRPSH